jgi:hypothetical protein
MRSYFDMTSIKISVRKSTKNFWEKLRKSQVAANYNFDLSGQNKRPRFYSRLLERYLKTTWTVYPPPRMVVSYSVLNLFHIFYCIGMGKTSSFSSVELQKLETYEEKGAGKVHIFLRLFFQTLILNGHLQHLNISFFKRVRNCYLETPQRCSC